MIDPREYYQLTAQIETMFPYLDFSLPPWLLIDNLPERVAQIAKSSSFAHYIKIDEALVHPDAIIEPNVTLKGPIIISKGCFLAANSYIRGCVLLGNNVTIGPGSEVKSSIIVGNTALAHLNYVGNSVLGSQINLEAGVVLANHHNESIGKTVRVQFKGKPIDTGVLKFGSIIGDGCKIGANSVLSPGTMLQSGQIVERLTLVNQSRS